MPASDDIHEKEKEDQTEAIISIRRQKKKKKGGKVNKLLSFISVRVNGCGWQHLKLTASNAASVILVGPH